MGSWITRIERWDSLYGIPRRANEQYLPAYQAFKQWSGDMLWGAFSVFCGVWGAWLLLFVCQPALQWRYPAVVILWTLALLVILSGLLEASWGLWGYSRWTQKTSHGSARWAHWRDLQRHQLLVTGEANIPAGWLPLGQLGRDKYFVLPPAEWLRHIIYFGPTGSGKSKSFFMWQLRYLARGASAVVVDPKGELYAQTAHYFRQVYRLDLVQPARSDRWNFLPSCQGPEAAEVAHALAGMMLGIEQRQRTSQDPFWGNAEHVALTAVLLLLPELVPEPTPAQAYDYVCARDDETFAQEMSQARSSQARRAYQAFAKAPAQTQGSIMIGLANRLQQFALPNVRAVMAARTSRESQRGVKQIDFATLRQPGTAIFIVVPEGDADRYKDVLATFIGQGVRELRAPTEGAGEPTPVLFLIDEARNIPVGHLRQVSAVGRGRGIGLLLGYQDLPQLYAQFTGDGGREILETLMTKVFLPGVSGDTAKYGAELLGATTAHSYTTVDGAGEKNDNLRAAEISRQLRDAAELRQMPQHLQQVIVSSTVPPVKCGYLSLAVRDAVSLPAYYGPPAVSDLPAAEEQAQAWREAQTPPASRLLPIPAARAHQAITPPPSPADTAPALVSPEIADEVQDAAARWGVAVQTTAEGGWHLRRTFRA